MLAPKLVQSLLGYDFAVERCDEFTPLPGTFVPIRIDSMPYDIGGNPSVAKHVLQCYRTLHTAIGSADITPSDA